MWRTRNTDRGGGFSLLEVVVSLGLLAMISAAVAAQVIVGLRAAATARDLTQAKGLVQARMEQMRNMPYFVGRSAGDYIDVLDTYYRNTTKPATTPTCTATAGLAVPQVAWSGFVAASDSRCAYEPTGPMYRKVINPIVAPGMGAFAMVVNTQFITPGSPPSPVTPQAGYDSQVAGSDVPSSNQIGVTVSVIYKTQSGYRAATAYTQISQRTPVNPMIESSVSVGTLRIGSVIGSVTPAHARLDAGVINLVGELSTGSKVTASATAAAAGTALGAAATGAEHNATAPGDDPAVDKTGIPGGLFGDCSVACFGTTAVAGVGALASDGLPLSGTPTQPVQAFVPASTTLRGIRFSNGATGTRLALDPNAPMISLDTDAPASSTLVTDCKFTSSAAPTYLGATAFLHATKDVDTPEVRACGTAQGGTIVLFPTTFAPDGIVRVDLTRASVDCKVLTSGTDRIPTADVDYRARVRYFNGSGYSNANLVERGNGTDPLASVNLNTVIGPDGQRLGDYIASWRSLSAADVSQTATGNHAEATLPGVVTIATQPTREGASGGTGPYSADPASGLSVQIGSLHCKSVDAR